MRVLVVTLTICFALIAVSSAADLYVDNQRGDDQNPGTKEKPFLTFKKSLEELKGGDTLHIVPNDKPYDECFGELGKKHSGTPERTTVVDGHGAKLTRLTQAGPEEWKSEGDDRFSLHFKHNVVVMGAKGYYNGFPFVFVDGKALSCVAKLEDLAPDSCHLNLAWDMKLKKRDPDFSKLTVKLKPGKTPANTTIMIPRPNNVVVGGNYITVKNMDTSWSSSDLFDTHRGKGIVFENIRARNCLDQCISAHSTAGCLVRYCFFRNALAMCALDITFRPEEDCRMTYNGCIFERGGAGFQGSGHYVVENCIFRDNSRSAVMARGNAHLKVKNCILFAGEKGRGGLSVSGHATLEAENCTIVGFKEGAFVFGKDAVMKLKNCVFIDCETDFQFYNVESPEKQLVAENVVLSAKPVFKVQKETIKGWEELRKKYPGIAENSQKSSAAAAAGKGCAIPATLTLSELKNLVRMSERR